MITSTNNTSQNFKSLYRLPSFKELGTQGRLSFEITKPLLHQMSEDCDTYVGAFAIQGQPKLAIYCTELLERVPPKKVLDAIFGKTIDLYTKLSCSKAISPESMATNAKAAKTDYLVVGKNNLEKAVELEGLFQEFTQTPNYLDATKKYESSFSILPNADELLTDRVLCSFIMPMHLHQLNKRELVK